MFFTITVPAAVPSDFQSSWPLPSSAENSSVPFRLARADGFAHAVPAAISFTRTVPAPVPLLFQSSVPPSSVSAEKYNTPLTLVIPEICDPPTPVRMSLTRVAPVPVAEHFQSSSPATPLSATKNTLLPACTKLRGEELNVPRKRSLMTAVFAVRSCRHSSLPFTPS